MKRKILFAALICACSTTTFAQTSTTIYWGAKASSNPNNPCSGATTRICGKMTTSANSASENSTIVEKCTYNSEDILIHHDTYIDNRPVEVVWEEIEAMTHQQTPIINDRKLDFNDPEDNNDD